MNNSAETAAREYVVGQQHEKWDQGELFYTHNQMEACFLAGHAYDTSWIKVTDKPLIEQSNLGWVATEAGDKEFIAALQYVDNSSGQPVNKWWIRHCVLEDSIGLCVVGDDYNEPAGWDIEDVTHYQPLPTPPAE